MINTNTKLKFGLGNSKLAKSIANFSLPAGHSCPFAKECLSKSNRLTGKLIDGQHCKFRCFAATGEARMTTVRKARWHNFDMLRQARSIEKMGKIIQDSLIPGIDKVRVHVSGDFFSETYYLAWLNVAVNNPMTSFYGYTKALPHLVKYAKWTPNNFRFTASRGGTHDHLIEKHGLVSAEVVFSIAEANDKGLEIDHDDSLAFARTKSFALLLHGGQPAGTPAGLAWAKLQRDGIGGYSKHGKDFRHFKKERPFTVFVNLNHKIKGFKFVPKTTIGRGLLKP
jgi:hypothetical protein